MYLALDEAKHHCRVDTDFTDDDAYIVELVLAAEVSLASRIHDTLADLEDGNGQLPLDLKHALKFIVGQWYENREPVVLGTITAKIPHTLDDIIQDYINRTIA